jgi:hypothetical protein
MPIAWAIVIIALWLAVAGLAVIVLGVLRQVTTNGQRAPGQSSRMMGPARGTQVPDFVGRLRDRPNVLLFLSSGCGPCQQLVDDMRATGLGDLIGGLTVLTDPGGAAALSLPADVHAVEDHEKKVALALDIQGRPFAVAVDENGIVRATSVPNKVADLFGLAVRARPADIQLKVVGQA